MIAVLITMTLFAGMTPVYAADNPPTENGGFMAEAGNPGDFPLAANGTAATIWVDAGENAPVRRVVNDFKEDIKRVADLDANVSSAAVLPAGPVVIVGTLDGSGQIKTLVDEGKIAASEVSAIKDKWEAYLIKVVDENTLVIAGSDSRGAVFGVYEISERMGVSPWYFFADAAIQTKNAVYVTANTSIIDMPDVQYRGVFLNDEEKLSRWATEVFKDPDTMGPKTYAKIFELILRLKGNYIWAAMHVNSINNVPGNIDLVQEYGIVLGSSHPDMLLRTNVHEWDRWKSDYAQKNGLNANDIKYDYTVSKEALLQYWRENIERHKNTDAQWTLGMRGLHDEAFNAENLMSDEYQHLGNNLEDRKAGLMNEIIRDQQQLLKEVLDQDKYAKSFQALIPYKEVLPIYNNPTFDLPENVTVIWCDDNHGMMRRMPDAAERAREGGHGLYYHVSYWAPVDQSYLWLSSIPLALMGEELSKSWEHNIRKSWILNVGDIKPQEAEMTFFIRYGWDVERYKNQADQFLKDWIGEHFGSQYSDEAADILTAFYQHTIVRKLEHMKDGLFNQTHYGDESSKRVAVYQDLFDRTAAIYNALPEEQKLAFYELVQSKINWAYYVNKAYYYADKSNLAFDQGRMASADAMLRLSQEADLAKKAEIERYSTMADGKWKGFIDPENAAPPVINQLPPGTPALVLGEPSMGVVVQGETAPQENSRLVFSPYNQDGKFIDVFNKGAGSVSWTASANEPWVQLSSASGTVHDETRLWVAIDQMEAHKGATAAITITDTATGATKTIQAAIESPAAALSAITGYAEADGYVSMEAEHYSRLNTNGDKTWQIIHDAGRAFGHDVVRAYAPDLGAVEESAITAAAPSLEYDINLTSSGQFPLEVYRIPTLNSKGKVRFAVSVDDGVPIVVESAAADEGQGTIWVSNLFHMIEKHVVTLPALSAGKHTVKLWMVDSFIMIDKMVLYTGPEGVVPSELGPDESYHHEYNTEFSPGTEPLPWTSKAAEPKNIPAGWGKGAFVEADGKVSLEAEYAMEHVLESESQITADMKAYTVSKRDKAAQVPGKIPNGWRLTQSDTGMAMRLPDLGGQWSENAEFPVYSPELTYKINFGNTGTYNVWLRWRYVDNASDSIRGGLDGSLGNFSTDVFFSNNLDEKWHWKNVGKVSVATAGEHSFNLWMREDGLYVDRIYLTKSSETPTDAIWNPSLRTESTVGQRLQAAVNAKRAAMSGISYPLGDALGHYRQSAYDSLMSALNAADALAKSGTATEQQADEALNAITAAEAALPDALVLERDGKAYNAYRDFSGDEVGKFPYGFNIEGMTNGAAASVQEEDGNRFLRLTTTSTSGKSDLFLPYAGEVKAAGNQRIVVEYRARFNGSFQYANGAMVRNDSGTGNYSMVTAFENASGVHQIKVHKGTSNADKVSVKSFDYNQWHTFKMVANWDARTYTVYMDNDPVPVATDFSFRHTGGTKLTGQRFGIDNMPNGSIDFDDFKVSIIDPTKPDMPRIKVAAVGDSITFGSDSAGPIKPEDKYPAKLQSLLGANYEVGNFGVSGASMLDKGTDTGGAQKGYVHQGKYTESKAFQPDVVIIMLGTNDSKALNWEPYKAEYVDNALELIKSYRDLDSHPVVYLATSPTVVPGANRYGIQADVLHNEIVPLQKQIALIADSGFIDVHDATKNATLEQFPDYVHGNAAGYTWIANAIHAGMTAEPAPKASGITQVHPVELKSPSGQTPKLPLYAPVVYADGNTGVAEVSWNLEGLTFNSPGIVQVPGKLKGLEINAAAAVEVIPGWGLDEIVDEVRSRTTELSIPLGEGVGSYSLSAYNALLAALVHAEELSADGNMTEEQFNQARNALAQAEAALTASLQLTENGVTYNAHRDFENDITGKLPFGIEATKIQSGGAAQIAEEAGNKFLRLTTGTGRGYANMFLPYIGQVSATGDQRVVVEYSARFKAGLQYANAFQPKNQTGAFAMTVAFENVGNDPWIKVAEASVRKNVQPFSYDTWHHFKIIADMDAQAYSVYMDNKAIAENFAFRTAGSTVLTGHVFGIDNFANGQVDFDNIKVMVAGGQEKAEQAAPEGLGTINETAAGANDGRILGVAASMEWSSDNGSTWSSAEGDTIANLAPGAYWVRYRETDTHKASPHMELNILRFSLPGNVTGVSLDKTSAQLYTNYGSPAVQLTAWIEPADAINKAVTWATSNSVVASVYDGLVTAHSAGTAVIKVTTVDGGYSDTCTVTVSVYSDPGTPVPVTGVSLNKTGVQLYTNYGDSTLQLTANVEPADASDKTVVWSTSNPAVATVNENGLVSARAAGTAVITATTADGSYTASCVVTVGVYESDDSNESDGDDQSGGGNPTVPTAPATTIKNEDGSTTTTVTDQTTGTVTETTNWPNGDREVVKTERDGTVTTTITGANGSKQETVTKPDGSSHSVVTDTKGVKVETSTTSLGEITANIHLPEGMAQAKITIPVKAASASTVVVMVHKDGTREVIKTAVRTENGLSFTAKSDMTVKLMDNKIVFQDVPASHWAAEAIAFTASRELFLGTGEGIFAPDEALSRAMLYTVLARFHGVETGGGASWYSKAQDWAIDSGISDGSAPEAAITREQLITILHRYAGQPAAGNTSKSFADSGEISVWASGAMDWAVQTGILNGKPGNLLEPASVVFRAEVSAILARFIAWSSN
ncbi:glycosyl hydrolase 115 family protein [Paenibacillus sp. YN15]|uniref:glycosyl hydrolase 115 family protein n=1 Tax=Paenibacillus sp. YN15 TaxID=1742774 RepID=UPI00215BBA07|nr:glycosyl hydrolase 115 family protein [Paenibacillus sp. YN15]